MTTPDSGIQKNTILKSDLPALDSNRKYFIRYRIKSKNGLATTAWSPIYRPQKPSVQSLFDNSNTPAAGTYNTLEKEVKSHGKSFDVSWKIKNNDTGAVEVPEQIKDLALDVYVKWDDQPDWSFVVTTTGNSFSLPIPAEYQSTVTQEYFASFMVHLSTFSKNSLPTDVETMIFYIENKSTRAVYDGGSLTP